MQHTFFGNCGCYLDSPLNWRWFQGTLLCEQQLHHIFLKVLGGRSG